MLYETGINAAPVTLPNSYSSDDVFDSNSLVSRSHIKLTQSPASTLERRPVSVIHHTAMRNSSLLDSPSIGSSSSSSSAKFVVQTTSFPESTTTIETPSLRRKHPLSSTNSTGFQVQHGSSIYKPVVVQKQVIDREESPLPIVDNPLFQQKPPRKPPRTFQHENRYDQKVPSSSSSASDSPTFDLGKF